MAILELKGPGVGLGRIVYHKDVFKVVVQFRKYTESPVINIKVMYYPLNSFLLCGTSLVTYTYALTNCIDW